MQTPRHVIQQVGVVVALSIAVVACSSAAATPSPSAAPTPAPASAAASASGPTTVSTGAFHKVDGDAAGSAFLLHLANGAFEVTLEEFSIPAIAHTNLIMVNNMDVLKTIDIDQKAILDLGPLKAPSGMQDFAVPAAMAGNAMGYRTVVLWDTQMLHAIAAAPLTEP